MALIQFKRIAIRPLTPTPTVADIVSDAPTFTITKIEVTDIGGQKSTVTVPVPFYPPKTAILGNDEPGPVTLLYNDSDTGIGYKEWAIWRQGLSLVVSWGRCGTKLQRNYSLFKSVHEAERTMEARIAQKRARGYRNNP